MNFKEFITPIFSIISPAYCLRLLADRRILILIFSADEKNYFVKKQKLSNSKWRRFHNSQKIWLALRPLKPNLMNQACNKCIFVTRLKLLPTYLTTDVKPRQTAEIRQKMQICDFWKTFWERLRDFPTVKLRRKNCLLRDQKVAQSNLLSYYLYKISFITRFFGVLCNIWANMT